MVIHAFPGGVIELVCRTIKDVLADTHDSGLLAYCIRERKKSSLSLYVGFWDGLRKQMFHQQVVTPLGIDVPMELVDEL